MRANYRVEFASGVFLLLGIAAMVWLATTATNYGRDIGKETDTITARFQNIAELKDRAPVKIGGVMVGEVESIVLDPVSFEAVVTMKIATRFNEIPSDTGAAVITAGVLGDRYIGLEPGGAPDMLQDGDEIFITQSAFVLEQAVGKFIFNAGSDSDEE